MAIQQSAGDREMEGQHERRQVMQQPTSRVRKERWHNRGNREAVVQGGDRQRRRHEKGTNGTIRDGSIGVG